MKDNTEKLFTKPFDHPDFFLRKRTDAKNYNHTVIGERPPPTHPPPTSPDFQLAESLARGKLHSISSSDGISGSNRKIYPRKVQELGLHCGGGVRQKYHPRDKRKREIWSDVRWRRVFMSVEWRLEKVPEGCLEGEIGKTRGNEPSDHNSDIMTHKRYT